MYEQYFAFKRAPFSIAPDPSFLYPSPQHREGLDHLLYGVQKEGGFIVLTGEVGTGKTTLCRLFLRELPDGISVATVLNAKLNTEDLLSNICQELSVSLDNLHEASQFQKTDAISNALLENHNNNIKTLLIIEEAQNLNPDALETLRLLTNLETDTSKLLHILLIGQPELVATLNRPDLRQLSQRIIARFHLQPLSLDETKNYITHRLSVAGGQNDVFKKSAINALYDTSQGIPRLINLIADRSLLNVFTEKNKHANAKHVHTAATIINGQSPAQTPKSLTIKPTFWLGLTVCLLIVALGFISMTHWPKQTAQKNTASQNTIKPEPAVANNIPQDKQPTPARIDLDEALLKLWGINKQAKHDLCTAALLNDLKCIRLNNSSTKNLRQYNRPALVTVFNQQGIARKMLLKRINNDSYVLLSQNGEQVLSTEDFALRWRGDADLLWKPAPGFIDSINVGERSLQTVFWLQDALNRLAYVEGKVITGGVYTQLLSEKVQVLQADAGLKADGILGNQTIMAINSQLKNVPSLQE